MDCKLDIEEIRALLPHRYPLLLVDRVLEMQPGVRVVGQKNVTINEAFFQGHFPGQAIMPGVLILEAMAQVSGLMMLAVPDHQGKLAYIATIENARFRRPVVPGDVLITEAKLLRVRGSFGKARMVARVDGVVVAECEMTFALQEPTPATTQEVYSKLGLGPIAGNGAGRSIAECAEDRALHTGAGEVVEQLSRGETDRE